MAGTTYRDYQLVINDHGNTHTIIGLINIGRGKITFEVKIMLSHVMHVILMTIVYYTKNVFVGFLFSVTCTYT